MYCVNCGVKLGESEKKCPLCGLTAFHPELPRPNGEPLYPTQNLPAMQVNRRSAQIILTALFLLPLEQGRELAKSCNAEVLWIDGNMEQFMTENFPAMRMGSDN
jgi:thiamine biosynthesis lipoprotein ApbE